MRNITLSIIALSAALGAGAVSAQSINPGVAQLAATAGVSADRFTQAQLIQLIDAQRDNDRERINFILGQAGSDVSRSEMGSPTSPGAAQLALSAGVEPGRFTQVELIRLIDAQRAEDTETVAYILSGDSRATTDDATISAGRAQLAASLGVNAADYTLAELSALYTDKIDAD